MLILYGQRESSRAAVMSFLSRSVEVVKREGKEEERAVCLTPRTLGPRQLATATSALWKFVGGENTKFLFKGLDLPQFLDPLLPIYHLPVLVQYSALHGDCPTLSLFA